MKKYAIFGVAATVILGVVFAVIHAQLWSHYKPYDETVRLEAPFLETIRIKYPDVSMTIKNEGFPKSEAKIHHATSPALFFGVFDPKEPITIFVKDVDDSYGSPCPSQKLCSTARVAYMAPLAADRTALVRYTEFILPPTNSIHWKVTDASLDRLVWRYDNKEDVKMASFLGIYFGGMVAWVLAMCAFLLLYAAGIKTNHRPRSGPK